jgi:5-methylthioadenosine/S-adenosylhomocysteine deaminase
MPDERIVIRHGHVLTMDPELGDIAHGDVLIQGSQIAAVGPGLAAPGAAEIDARGMIVAPGLVDTHWHLWNTLLRSMSDGGAGYFRVTVGLGLLFGPDDVYQGTRLGCAEAKLTCWPPGCRSACRWTAPR